MNNEINIKKAYLFDEKEFKNATKKEKNKKTIWTISILLILLISVFTILYITNKHLAESLFVIYIIACALAIVSGMSLLFSIMFLLNTTSTTRAICKSRVYAISSDSEIFTFRYMVGSYYQKYDDSILDEFSKLLSSQISRKKEIEEEKPLLSDLTECLNIVNVYEVKEKEDCIEIKCDYINLLNNTSSKEQKLTVYKYYKNWEDLLDSLKAKKESKKKEITLSDGTYSYFVDFMLKGIRNKSNAILFYVTFAGFLICSITNAYAIAFWIEAFIAALIGSLYLKKKTLKYLYDDSKEEKELLLKRIRFDTIVLIEACIVLLIYVIINTNTINMVLTAAVILSIILLLAKKTIKK